MSITDLQRYLELSRQMAHALLHGKDAREWEQLDDAASDDERAQAKDATEDEMWKELETEREASA